MSSTDEEKLLLFLRSNPEGVCDKDISKLPGMDNAEKRVLLLNQFILKDTITLKKLPGGKLIYKFHAPASEVDGLRDADNEEKVVYRIIEDTGNKGIWIREIRNKCHLTQPQLNKIIKALESKKMIKSVQTVLAGKKKVFMLYHLEPDSSLTGGAWYSDRDFDSDFVDGLNQGCYRFLKMRREEAKKLAGGPLIINNSSYASVSDVCSFINKFGLSSIPLSETDIEQILTTLIYDGKVERKSVDEKADGTMFNGKSSRKTITTPKYLYKAVESLLPAPGLVRSPCGICPVFKNCTPQTTVNPKTCNYLSDWLL